MATVLVRGGSGWIASYCILALCQSGHAVRTTVRDLKRAPDVRAMMTRGGLSAGRAKEIEFFAADLQSDGGWREAIEDGQRFVATSEHSIYIIDIARILRRRLSDRAGRLARWTLPIWLTRLLAKRKERLRAILPHLGKNLDASSDKAKRLLGWAPRPLEQSIVDTAESLIRVREEKSLGA